MDTDTGSLGWFLVTGFVIPAGFLLAAFRSPSDRQVSHWASVAGIRLTSVTEPVVRRRLGRGRRFRSAAAFPLWWLGSAPVVFGSEFAGGHSSYHPALGAYLLGAVLAELTAAGPSVPQGPRRAELSPRSVATYLPSWMRWAPRVLVGTAAAQLALSASIDADPVAAIVPLMVSFAVVCLAEVAAWRIASHPQRTGDLDVIAADDALRATAVSLTACAALIGAIGATTSATGVLLAPARGWAVWAALPWFLVLQGAVVGALSVVVRQENLGYWRRVRQPAAAAA